jgi:flagellar hook assembly protein FlgD
VEAYNEAGERVKLITSANISANINGFETYVNGEKNNVFNPNEADGKGDLYLRFPGIITPEQNALTYVEFAWDGTNESGQEINQGVYFIKVSIQDEYGHTETTIKEVQLIKTEEYTRISIYNGAGEIVSLIETPLASGSIIDLTGLDDVLYVGTGGTVPIKYGSAGQALNWDGKNLDGQTVSNGIYEIVVEVKTATGYETMASKTVTVLSEEGAPMLVDSTGKLFPKIYPNPLITNSTTPPAVIDWFLAVPGEITVRIYNVAGELVRKLEGDLNAKPMTWDLREQNGQAVSSGLFIIVMQAKADDGRRETAVTKFVVIRQGDLVTP